MIKAGKVTLLLFIVLVAISGWVEISGRHTPDHWLWGCGLEDDPDESTDEQCWWGSGFDDLLDLTAVILYISVILLLIGYPMRVLTNPERIRRKAEIEFAARNYKGAMALYKKIGDLEKISECASQLEAPQSVAAPTSTPSSDADDTITHVRGGRMLKTPWSEATPRAKSLRIALILIALSSIGLYGYVMTDVLGLSAQITSGLLLIVIYSFKIIRKIAKLFWRLLNHQPPSNSHESLPDHKPPTNAPESPVVDHNADDDDFRKYAVPRGKGVGRVEWKETESGWELVGENTAAEEE